MKNDWKVYYEADMPSGIRFVLVATGIGGVFKLTPHEARRIGTKLLNVAWEADDGGTQRATPEQMAGIAREYKAAQEPCTAFDDPCINALKPATIRFVPRPGDVGGPIWEDADGMAGPPLVCEDPEE